MPRVAMPRFRDEVLSLYSPPARSRNSWFKARQVLDILESLGVKTTSQLTPDVIPRFIASNPKWKPETVKGMLAYLAPICKYAKMMGYVAVNPFEVRKDWYKAPEPDWREDDDDDWDWDDLDGDAPEYLTLDKLWTLLEFLERDVASWKGGRLHAMVWTFAYTGLRKVEGLTLAVNDFNFAKRVLRLKVRTRRHKTRASSRPVGMPRELLPILEAWLPRSGSRWAFPGVTGIGPWLGGQVGRRPIDELKAAGLAAGIGKVNFQMLRHSWATHAELRGIGELIVQRQLRHTSKRTQLHYRHADLTNLANAVEGFTLRPDHGHVVPPPPAVPTPPLSTLGARKQTP